MSTFLHYIALSAPLFAVVALGYGIGKLSFWKRDWTQQVSKFVFAVPLPGLLFHMMSTQARGVPVDTRLLVAYFGSCLIVFGIGRAVAYFLFEMDGRTRRIGQM